MKYGIENEITLLANFCDKDAIVFNQSSLQLVYNICKFLNLQIFYNSNC